MKQRIQSNGIIASEPERKDSGQVFTLRAGELKTNAESCPSGILIRIKTKLYPRFTYGDNISFAGKLSKPFNFRSDTGRSFDYEGYLAKDQVFYEIKSGDVEFISKSSPDIFSALYFIKRNFVSNLERVLGEPHAALASGLVVGEKAALGSDLIDDFRTVGLIHIVVLSGYNITIVADALRKMLSFLPRVWGIIAGAIGIICFGILVGGGATVIRSCFMASISLTADLIRRDYSVERAIAFAGLIMLIQNPLILLHDPSFQLSFLATLGLILLSKPAERLFYFLPEKFGIRGIIASTVATQIFVSPYILYMMGQISLIGFITNILVLPFIPLTMLFVFLTGAGGFISFQLSYAMSWFAHALLSYELAIVENFARIPYASLHVQAFSGWIIAGVYSGYAVVYILTSFPRKRESERRSPLSRG